MKRIPLPALATAFSLCAMLSLCAIPAAHAQATQITSASSLAPSDATITYPVIEDDVAILTSFTGSAGGTTLSVTPYPNGGLLTDESSSYFAGDFDFGIFLLRAYFPSALSITFSPGVSEFGLKAQDDAIDTETFTLALFHGATPLGVFTVGPIDNTVGLGTAGFLGARSATPITSVVISSVSSAAGFNNWFLIGPVTFGSPGPPTITHLYPASRTIGRDSFTLTVAGTGFTSDSQVQWNGAAQATTFVSGTTLTASIPASLIAVPGTAQVAVNTNGTASNSHIETIMPRPTLSSVSPSSKSAGSNAFILRVTGTGFRPASFYSPTVVKWNGTVLTTTYVSETQMTALVPASLLTKPGTASVTVTTPQVATSAGRTFTIE